VRRLEQVGGYVSVDMYKFQGWRQVVELEQWHGEAGDMGTVCITIYGYGESPCRIHECHSCS